MDIGLLWYDDDKQRSLEEKVNRAVAYYWSKYGESANTCFVHPRMLAPDGAPRTIGAVIVRPMRNVIKNHFWLGIERSTDEQPAVSESQ